MFRVPVSIVSAVPTLARHIRAAEDAVLVAPDAGAVELAEQYSAELGTTRVAVVMKDRMSGEEVETSMVAAESRPGSVVSVDDMITNGATIVTAVEALRSSMSSIGSLQIAATHGVLVGEARRAVSLTGADPVFPTDTVDQDDLSPPFRQVSRRRDLRQADPGDELGCRSSRRGERYLHDVCLSATDCPYCRTTSPARSTSLVA